MAWLCRRAIITSGTKLPWQLGHNECSINGSDFSGKIMRLIPEFVNSRKRYGRPTTGLVVKRNPTPPTSVRRIRSSELIVRLVRFTSPPWPPAKSCRPGSFVWPFIFSQRKMRLCARMRALITPPWNPRKYIISNKFERPSWLTLMPTTETPPQSISHALRRTNTRRAELICSKFNYRHPHFLHI